MKLGFLLFEYFPFGGLQRDCLHIAQACTQRGHKVWIFARSWEGPRPQGIEVVLCGEKGWTNTGRNRHFTGWLRRLLPPYRFDAVIGFNKLAGLDLYYGADPCFQEKLVETRAAWYRWLPRYRQMLREEYAVFGPSSTTEILLLTSRSIPIYQRFYGTALSRFHLLPPPLVRRDFTDHQIQEVRQRIRQQWGAAQDQRVLLFVGSGFRTKGLDRVISALGSLPGPLRLRTQLLVVGRNHPEPFARQARRLGVPDQVHFLGGRHDVPDFLMAADLLVHPAYSENTGTVLLEALTCGLPVLTTDSCGYAPHIEQAGAGVVIPSPFDQTAFNHQLEEMLDSPLRSVWSRKGREYSAREDLYSCHDRAAELLEAVARKNQKGTNATT